MSSEPEIRFSCVECSTDFGITLASVGESSTDDLCCPVCRGNQFMAVTRLYEDER